MSRHKPQICQNNKYIDNTSAQIKPECNNIK